MGKLEEAERAQVAKMIKTLLQRQIALDTGFGPMAVGLDVWPIVDPGLGLLWMAQATFYDNKSLFASPSRESTEMLARSKAYLRDDDVRYSTEPASLIFGLAGVLVRLAAEESPALRVLMVPSEDEVQNAIASIRQVSL
jgi:hypothetical protein